MDAVLGGGHRLSDFASASKKLGHSAAQILDRCPVEYVWTNNPQLARDIFYGLREAKPDLVGVVIFDRIDRELRSQDALIETMWKRKEIENYIVSKETLLEFAATGLPQDLFGHAETGRRKNIMAQCVSELEGALKVMVKPPPWSADIKVTDDFLNPLFKLFYEKIGLGQVLYKSDYHVLADCVDVDTIDAEIVEKLDLIVQVAEKANGLDPTP